MHRRKFSREFKLEAVKLFRDRRVTINEGRVLGSIGLAPNGRNGARCCRAAKQFSG